MTSFSKPITDSSVMYKLQTSNQSGWHQLYDKYAPIIYGSIVKIIPDKEMANQIFQECFINLKKTDILTQTKKSLPLFLLQHTYRFTIYYLKMKGLSPVEGTPGTNGR